MRQKRTGPLARVKCRAIRDPIFQLFSDRKNSLSKKTPSTHRKVRALCGRISFPQKPLPTFCKVDGTIG